MGDRRNPSPAGSGNTNRIATRRNPIIGETWEDTLHNAACGAAFVARYHRDNGEAKMDALAEKINPAPSDLAANEAVGLGLLCGCIAAALAFELEGRQ